MSLGIKIFTISDIHLEFLKDTDSLTKDWPDADILVLAGDIGNVTTGLRDIENFLVKLKGRYKDIVFVAGNHEFYNCNYDRDKVITNLRKLADETKTHFLHRDSKVIQGIEFIGATLWSLLNREISNKINDFECDVFKSHIDYVESFIDDYRFIKQKLETVSKFPRIVVTHHLPTARLIHRRFQGDPINSAFYTNILDNINTRGVVLWFCGHTHEYAMCKYNGTYFFVNPIGYPGEKRESSISLSTYDL